MNIYTHTLTPVEEACGVTLEAVADALPQGLFVSNGTRFALPGNLGAAVAQSTARCAFSGREVEFRGFNTLGMLVYGVKS